MNHLKQIIGSLPRHVVSHPVGNGGLSTSSGRLVYYNRYYPPQLGNNNNNNNNSNKNKPKIVRSDTVLRSYCSSSGKANDGQDAKGKNFEVAAATTPSNVKPRTYEKMIEAYASEIETIKRQHRVKLKKPASPRNILTKLPFDTIMSNLTKADRTKRSSNGYKNQVSARRREPSPTPRLSIDKEQPPKRDYYTKSSDAFYVDVSRNDSSNETKKKTTPKLVRVADLKIKIDNKNDGGESQPNEGKKSSSEKSTANGCGKIKSPNNLNTYAKIVKALEKESGNVENNSAELAGHASNLPRAKQLPGWLTPEYKWQNKLKVYPRDPNYSEDEDPSVIVFEQEDKTTTGMEKQASKSKKDKGGPDTDRSESEVARTTRLKRKKTTNIAKVKQHISEVLEKRQDELEKEKSEKQQEDKDDKPATKNYSRVMANNNNKSSNHKQGGVLTTLQSMASKATTTSKLLVSVDLHTSACVMDKKENDNNNNDDSEVPLENTKRENTIDQTYRFRRVSSSSSGAFVPIKKRKDGTLIDYGFQVPTRKKKRKKSPTSPAKKNNNRTRGGGGGGGGGSGGGASSNDNNVEPKKTASLPQQQIVPELQLNRATNLSYILERASVPSPKSRIPRLLSHNAKRKKKLEEEQQQQQQQEKKLIRSETRILERATFPELKFIDNAEDQQQKTAKEFIYSPWLDRFHTRKAPVVKPQPRQQQH